MAKDDLENKVKRAIVKIGRNVEGIYNILTDLSLKLCHIITDMKDYRTYDKDMYR